MPTDHTHDPSLTSWVESANDPATDFPIQNLPLAAYLAEHDGHAHTHLAVAIGDQLLDVTFLAESGLFRSADDQDAPALLRYPFWDAAASRPGFMTSLRSVLQQFLRADSPAGQQARRLRTKALVPIAQARFSPPVRFLNYTDFYASITHASTVGAMFRPDNPLLPNYKHVPIGYHGRASSIVLSGTPITRPKGQLSPPDNDPGAPPAFSPSKLLDFELEVGCVIARGNPLGSPVPIHQAPEHILGLVLLNDWSARDIQKWEYQPLGPFLAKNFASTVSPFVVTRDALEPFRAPGFARAQGDPDPLPYLNDPADRASGGYDIALAVALQTQAMRDADLPPHPIASADFAGMYWSFAQMIAHHTSNGCNLLPGDLLGSGTVSNNRPDARGCLLELTWQGHDPATAKPLPRRAIPLPSGESRTFLADGDTVVLSGRCRRDGFRSIGFGQCSGTILPAHA
ncbi:MAG: fumarylacetoacetase [Phycisphaeraceae bacterium]|nr:MAG: fumarylacetoacetase [Phycisphaeraceae bacterium]